MLTLLVTAFLPKVGIEFDWVTYHWIAGTVLTISIIFHIIHATFFMDFWSIWPDRADIEDACVLAVLDERIIQMRIYRTGIVEAESLSVSTPPLPLVTIPLGNDIQAPAIGLFNGSRSPLQYCTW